MPYNIVINYSSNHFNSYLMKKKNLKSLKLNKTAISKIEYSEKIVGKGTINQTCVAYLTLGNGCRICETV